MFFFLCNISGGNPFLRMDEVAGRATRKMKDDE
jgi:hypothetical protein